MVSGASFFRFVPHPQVYLQGPYSSEALPLGLYQGCLEFNTDQKRHNEEVNQVLGLLQETHVHRSKDCSFACGHKSYQVLKIVLKSNSFIEIAVEILSHSWAQNF